MGDQGMEEQLGDPFVPGDKCINCVEENPAVAHCKNCSRLLCDECLRQHRRQVDTMSHEIVESQSAIEMKKRFQCPEHGHELNYYCIDCKKPVCQHCTMKEREHSITVAKDVKELLGQKLSVVKGKAAQFESHFEYIESVEQKNETEMTRCEKTIAETFQEMVLQLEERKKQVIHELHESTGTQQQYIKGHKDEVKNKLDKLKENIKAADSLLNTRQESKLMVERDELLAKLEEMAQFEWSTDNVNPTQWQMRTPPKEEYASRFGQILPKPETSKIFVEMNEDVTMGETNEFIIRVEPVEQISKCKIDKEISVKVTLTPDANSSLSGRSQGTLLHRTIKKLSGNVWSVSYFPRSRGTLSISVSVCGVEAHGNQFERQVEDGIKKGDKVVRGSDWKWDDQDGGSGNVGEVKAVKESGWVTVQWSRKMKPGDYRWGKDGKFDVKVCRQPQ